MTNLGVWGSPWGQDYYWGLIHAVDWLPTLGDAAGYVPTPRVKGIVIDGISHWGSIAANSTSPRTSVILDVSKPTVIPQWGDVGAGVVRKGNYKLHIGDAGQLQRPGDWSPPDSDVNGERPPPCPLHLSPSSFLLAPSLCLPPSLSL